MGEVGASLTPELIERFIASWHAIAPDGQVGLAVSGGPDSLALLVLFHEVAPRNFSVATVDHGLRHEAATEAAMVAAECRARGIPHDTLSVSLGKGSGLQERARHVRYAALAQWAREQGLVAIVTAHHADDQAETMVMRLNRGAGLRGLAGMRAVAGAPGDRSLPLLRPLLAWRRDDLAEVVRNAGLQAALDPSNHDQVYERVRIRDALASSPAFDPGGFALTSAHLADADAALEWAAEQLWKTVAEAGDSLTWQPAEDLPRSLAFRVLERVFAAFDVNPPRGSDLARLHDVLLSGGVATLAGIKADARGGPWRFTRAPERRT